MYAKVRRLHHVLLATGVWLTLPALVSAGFWDDVMYAFRDVVDQDFPATRILGEGDASNRVNIVVAGDGWAEGDIDEYRHQVDRLVSGVFNVTPYKEYRSHFTVTRLDVVSRTSGITQEAPLVRRDTHFKTWMEARRDASNNLTGRPPTHPWFEKTALSKKIMDNTNPDLPRDVMVIIVNDSNATGGNASSLGSSSMAYCSFGTTGTAVVEVMAHELGHALFKLADEYSAPNSGTRSPPSAEPPQANVTINCDPATVKWKRFIAAGVAGVGTQPGGLYVSTGVCRPKVGCMMRNHWADPFCEVCKDRVVSSIYERVTLTDQCTPEDLSIDINPEETGGGANQTFRVKSVGATDSKYEGMWFMDGKILSGGQSDITTRETASDTGPAYELTLGPTRLTSGNHWVAFRVIDKRTLVPGWTQPDILEERSPNYKIWLVTVRFLRIPWLD